MSSQADVITKKCCISSSSAWQVTRREHPTTFHIPAALSITSILCPSPQERGESYYNPMLKGIVDELKEGGHAEVSEGAMCVFVEGKEIPLIVQKSDGGFGYASTDMAAMKQRLTEEKADWIIYVTDVGQSVHFEMVFAAARKAGWLPVDDKAKPRVSHVAFGLVLGEDGKKFKTRSGDVVRLVELLDEAVSRWVLL